MGRKFHKGHGIVEMGPLVQSSTCLRQVPGSIGSYMHILHIAFIAFVLLPFEVPLFIHYYS